MAKKKNRQFGGLPPRYSFMLNPYPSERLSRCPLCEQKSRQRKLPLLIHIDPGQLIALNYTCRYCPACDLLVAPGMIGNDYLIIGTVEKRVWREGLEQPRTFDEMLPHVSDFANYYSELRQTRPGYYRVDQEPLTMEPPPSQEWVKS